MTLLHDLTTEYRKDHPGRDGRSPDYPDWLPALCRVLERDYVKVTHITKIPARHAIGSESNHTIRPNSIFEIYD